MAAEHQSPAALFALLSTEMALAEPILVESVPEEMPEYREDAIYLDAQFGNRIGGCEDSYFPIT